VGLTSRDIILFNQIIGFVGFQARAIAVLQAAQGFRCAGSPVCRSKRRHPRSCSPPPGDGRQTLTIPTCSMPMMSASGASPAGSRCPVWALAPLLACDPQLFAPLETLIRQLSTDDTLARRSPDSRARTNGSPTCFDAWLHWQGEEFASHLREGDRPSITGSSSILSPALVTAVQLLTRSPDRFSAAQLTPLAEYGLSAQQAIDLLTWSGLCGWMNRLKIALGNVRQQT
jgi:hypothetical protein